MFIFALAAIAASILGGDVAAHEDIRSVSNHDHRDHHHHPRGFLKDRNHVTRCSTPEPTNEDRQKAALVMDRWNKMQMDNDVAEMNGDIIIPTYIHLIHDTYEAQNEVSGKEQEQIDILNAAFPGYSFDLKEITVTQKSEWWPIDPDSQQELEMKAALRRGSSDALNIYYSDLKVYLGYATFPVDYGGNPMNDGVVCLHSAGVGGTTNYYNEGDTLTHEVGHWMGLFHTFFQGSEGCGDAGDQVEDTNEEAKANLGCPVGKVSCGSLDPINNFMDYTYDSCMDEFTSGQKARMDAMWFEYRAEEPVSESNRPSEMPSKKPSVMPSFTLSPSKKPVSTKCNFKWKLCHSHFPYPK